MFARNVIKDLKIECSFSEVDGEPHVRLGDEEKMHLDLDLKDARKVRQFLNDNYEKLRPTKDWENCPYEGHADDCDCNGMGGDR